MNSSQKTLQRTIPDEMGAVIVPPPVEMLFAIGEYTDVWPCRVVSNQELQLEVFKRKMLIDQFKELCGHIPNATMDVREAVTLKLISEGELGLFYRRTIELWGRYRHSRRLLLYFPIEFIPDVSWVPTSDMLKDVLGDFQTMYMKTWTSLLLEHDLRANFVDGDIPEVEMRTGPLPKVVKALHLAPVLIKKGLLTAEQLHEYTWRYRSDDILLKTLAEVMLLVNSPHVTTLHKSSHTEPGEQRHWQWLMKLTTYLQEDIERSRLKHVTQRGDKPETRVAWEIRRDRQHFINRCAHTIADALMTGDLPAGVFYGFIKQTDDQSTLIALVRAMQRNIESHIATDQTTAEALYLEFLPTLKLLWNQPGSELNDTIETLVSRLWHSNVIDERAAQEFGVTDAKLDHDVLIRDASAGELGVQVAHAIRTHPTLSQMLLPICIEYGSRIKGYGAKMTDRDVALFIRDHVSFASRSNMQRHLSTVLEPLGIHGKALEFWLIDNDNQLRIRDFEHPDRSLGDSTLAHVLFGGVWSGAETDIRDLYQRLLPRYLHSHGDMTLGEPSHALWVREMERDVLQYRLMHKGYSRFYADQRNPSVPYSTALDSESTFWDSGYRRLATILYLKKVFLPQQ